MGKGRGEGRFPLSRDGIDVPVPKDVREIQEQSGYCPRRASLDEQALVRQSLRVYRIIGADGREYGPVSSAQLAAWKTEGRVNAETRTLPEGAAEWKPLGSLPEFSLWFAKPPAPAGGPPAILPQVTPAQTTNGFAIASLVMGVISVTVGICCCYGLPFNLLGLIFALVGLAQIKQNPRLYNGQGAAIAGLILSLLSLALMAVLIVSLGLHSTWSELRRHAHPL
jgi:hypothetical protein